MTGLTIIRNLGFLQDKLANRDDLHNPAHLGGEAAHQSPEVPDVRPVAAHEANNGGARGGGRFDLAADARVDAQCDFTDSYQAALLVSSDDVMPDIPVDTFDTCPKSSRRVARKSFSACVGAVAY